MRKTDVPDLLEWVARYDGHQNIDWKAWDEGYGRVARTAPRGACPSQDAVLNGRVLLAMEATMNDTVRKIMTQALAGIGYKCEDCGTKYAKIPTYGDNSSCPNCGCMFFRKHPYDDPYHGIDWYRPPDE